MAKEKKSPKVDLDKLTPRQLWEHKYKLNRDNVDALRKLIYDYYEAYEPSQIKERLDLQMQIQLYRQEGSRLAQQAAMLCEQFWKLPKE